MLNKDPSTRMMFLDDVENQDPEILELQKTHFNRINQYILNAFTKKLRTKYLAPEAEKDGVDKHDLKFCNTHCEV